MGSADCVQRDTLWVQDIDRSIPRERVHRELLAGLPWSGWVRSWRNTSTAYLVGGFPTAIAARRALEQRRFSLTVGGSPVNVSYAVHAHLHADFFRPAHGLVTALDVPAGTSARDVFEAAERAAPADVGEPVFSVRMQQPSGTTGCRALVRFMSLRAARGMSTGKLLAQLAPSSSPRKRRQLDAATTLPSPPLPSPPSPPSPPLPSQPPPPPSPSMPPPDLLRPSARQGHHVETQTEPEPEASTVEVGRDLAARLLWVVQGLGAALRCDLTGRPLQAPCVMSDGTSVDRELARPYLTLVGDDHHGLTCNKALHEVVRIVRHAGLLPHVDDAPLPSGLEEALAALESRSRRDGDGRCTMAIA